uniref:SH2 domain-containing protein n=1 Tax=Hippocampus comes TaxID=109280 RepID=A0A3Q2XTK1_HIPCM
MHPDQAVGLQQTREALWENKNPWEVPREADFWQCKSAVPPYHICHSAALKQGAEQQRFILGPQQSYPSPQPLMDMRDGASSGYHTPPPPRQSCPCSPYQSSPVESHGSRGYASGYLSGSASPLPASSPSLGGGRLPETPAGDKDHSNAPGDGPSGSGTTQAATPSPSSNSLQNSPTESPGHSSPSATDPPEHRLTPERAGSTDTKPPSPVPDGYHTPTFPLAPYYYPLLNVPHVPYTGYTAITIPASQPPLPEKKRLSSTPGSLNGHVSHLRGSPVPSPTHNVTLPATMTEQRQGYAQFSSSREDIRVNAKFVQDSSKYWYKPSISRDQAIAVLKDKEPGTFLIRDSNSFQGAYGLALKVATPPPNANITGTKDAVEQLVRHFLIETGPRGVKIKGCQNEAYFGSLSALVYQHSITPISLPCALRIPERDLQELRSVTNTSTAADLLKQGAACNVLYLNSVDTESLTGPEAVSKASKSTLALSPRPAATVVHFKVSSQGITLTDSKRRLFFRRHYPISSVTFSSLDPQDQRMFGFVARRTGSATENVCHLFAELDPEQPAVAIVNFINKVMLGPQLRR